MKPRKGGEWPTSIRMPNDLHAFLVDEARRQSRSVTWLITEICQHYRAHIQAKNRTTVG